VIRGITPLPALRTMNRSPPLRGSISPDERGIRGRVFAGMFIAVAHKCDRGCYSGMNSGRMQVTFCQRCLASPREGNGNSEDGTRVRIGFAEMQCVADVRPFESALAIEAVRVRRPLAAVVVVLSCFCTLLDIAAA
jgi:hypothetical protein